MAEHDGWIAKDKYGDFWYGTLGKTRRDVEAILDNIPTQQRRTYKFKIIKLKLVEVR